jgi:hypothetical protein
MDLKDNELISRALDYWANHIETGLMAMSASDCVQRGKMEHIISLTPHQNALVNRLRILAREELNK